MVKMLAAKNFPKSEYLTEFRDFINELASDATRSKWEICHVRKVVLGENDETAILWNISFVNKIQIASLKNAIDHLKTLQGNIWIFLLSIFSP